MKKVVWPLAALALIAAIGFEVTTQLYKPTPTYSTMPRAAQPADAIANGLCRGAITVEMFAPNMGITQDDVDAYAERYTDAAKTCDEVTYLGSVTNPDESVDYLYRIVTAGRQNWYAFTVVDGLVENIQ